MTEPETFNFVLPDDGARTLIEVAVCGDVAPHVFDSEEGWRADVLPDFVVLSRYPLDAPKDASEIPVEVVVRPWRMIDSVTTRKVDV